MTNIELEKEKKRLEGFLKWIEHELLAILSDNTANDKIKIVNIKALYVQIEDYNAREDSFKQ